MIIIDDDGVMHKVLPMDTLDKIRAEIDSITPKATIRYGKLSVESALMIPLDKVLTIIDKYKAESEG